MPSKKSIVGVNERCVLRLLEAYRPEGMEARLGESCLEAMAALSIKIFDTKRDSYIRVLIKDPWQPVSMDMWESTKAKAYCYGAIMRLFAQRAYSKDRHCLPKHMRRKAYLEKVKAADFAAVAMAVGAIAETEMLLGEKPHRLAVKALSNGVHVVELIWKLTVAHYFREEAGITCDPRTKETNNEQYNTAN